MKNVARERWQKIRAVVLDIDGILTDGRIGYGVGSDEEIKYFHVRDGHGIKLAMRAGFKVGVNTPDFPVEIVGVVTLHPVVPFSKSPLTIKLF